ncbi:MAG: Uma2 family endonuclease [Armatimonadota bacterium]
MSAEKLYTPPQRYTVDDFFTLVRDDEKADLIDGVIHVASPDSLVNDSLTNFLHFLLAGYADERGLGTVVGSRFAFVLSEFRAPEPDVAFVSVERSSILQRTRALGAPDLAVEIVSEESRARDYAEKRVLYERAGVREYWIIDPARRHGEFLRLADNSFAPIATASEHYFHSSVVPGFWLDLRWLWESPLPRRLDCLNLILSGPPR